MAFGPLFSLHLSVLQEFYSQCVPPRRRQGFPFLPAPSLCLWFHPRRSRLLAFLILHQLHFIEALISEKQSRPGVLGLFSLTQPPLVGKKLSSRCRRPVILQKREPSYTPGGILKWCSHFCKYKCLDSSSSRG